MRPGEQAVSTPPEKQLTSISARLGIVSPTLRRAGFLRSIPAYLLLGLLIGLVISQALPVGAHSGSNPHLWKHIQSLRSSYSALASEVGTLQQDLTSSKNKIGVLE
jgi:hypothetical protein